MSIYYGQNAEFALISRTHGKFALGFNEQFDVDVSLSNKRLFFFNKKESLALSVFEGVSGRFGYLVTEENLANAATMDISPSGEMTNDDPGAYVEFHILVNSKSETGTVEQATFVKGCRITSAPETMAPREEQHVQISYIGATRYKVKGGGIKYVRFISSAPAYSTADDVVVSGTGPYSGTLPVSATAVNIENNTTFRSYLGAFRNGADITYNQTLLAGFSVSGTSVVFPSGFFDTTDVWDVMVPYAI